MCSRAIQIPNAEGGPWAGSICHRTAPITAMQPVANRAIARFVNAITNLVTDEQMQDSFKNTNFGHTDYRGLLAQGCIKAVAAWDTR